MRLKTSNPHRLVYSGVLRRGCVMKRTAPWRAPRAPGAGWAPPSDPDTLAWGESVASAGPPSVWGLCQRWLSRCPLFSVHTHTGSRLSWAKSKLYKQSPHPWGVLRIWYLDVLCQPVLCMGIFCNLKYVWNTNNAGHRWWGESRKSCGTPKLSLFMS